MVAYLRPEESLQRAVAQYLTLYESRRILAWCHVPNGGWRTKAEAGVLKAMGVKSGVPDILVWSLGRHFLIELKAPKGRMTDTQKAWADLMATHGFPVYLCRSLDDVFAALKAEGLPDIRSRKGVTA